MHWSIAHRLPELVELERLINSLGNRARVSQVGAVALGDISLPLYSVVLGSTDPKAPTFAIFGGVHGLERIGTQVVLAYLRTVVELLPWDKAMGFLLERSRLVFMPLVNPGGMFLKARSNPNGIDLMRNGPQHGDPVSPWALFSGHRISPRLPWYRGPAGADMEVEAKALCTLVEKEVFCSDVAIALDVHSGFGNRDRLWFPYARTRKPFPNLVEMFALKLLLDRVLPNHVYILEPQAQQYTAHGDLWDYLFDEHRKAHRERMFLPITLEMGSWLWARKNWRQMFNVLGAFNPMLPHRLQRTLRRHLLVLDFLHRAVLSPSPWLIEDKELRSNHVRRALELWYAP